MSKGETPRTSTLLSFTSNIAAMEILEDPKLQDAAMRELYEASMNGCEYFKHTDQERPSYSERSFTLPLH